MTQVPGSNDAVAELLAGQGYVDDPALATLEALANALARLEDGGEKQRVMRTLAAF